MYVWNAHERTSQFAKNEETMIRIFGTQAPTTRRTGLPGKTHLNESTISTEHDVQDK